MTSTQLDFFSSPVVARDEAPTRQNVTLTVAAITSLMAADPVHARDKQAVWDAIRTDAAAHSGEVDPNRVRERIPSWVYPRMIPTVYRVLKDAGVLTHARWNLNTDGKGRNVGKPQHVYRFRCAA